MAKKALGDVTSITDTARETVAPIAEKVLEGGQATLEETKNLAAAVLKQDGDETPNKEISATAEKVLDTGQATVEETKRLAACVLGEE